ncbi:MULTISPECIES: hypothetical protein [unclassified Nocardioides]|uniref:hypothetical protein n=1 Tax=unclassified Nocardioides TaxID=2615069 RepID=UPI001E33C7E6|nr:MULTISPECIES: hypothetical protein [unclassified Nocardioides]
MTFDAQQYLRRLLVGNWIGAGVVAAATLAVAGVFSVILALLIKPEGFGLDNTLTLTATLMTAAFGADLLVSPTGDLDLDALGYVGAFPLTITLASLGVAVFVFRRITATYTSAAVAAGDALRAAIITGIGAAFVALIFRGDNDALGAGLGDLEADDSDYLISWGTSVAGSLFMPIVMVAFVLTLSCVMRRDWLHPKLQLVHDWVAVPLAAFTGLIALLPIAGALCLAVILLFGDGMETSELTSDEWMTLTGLGIAYLANLGFGLIGLGAGVPLGSNGSASYSGGGESGIERFSEMHRLTWWTGEGDEPGLWIAVGVMPVWLLIGAFLVARATKSRPNVVRNQLVWVGSFLVFIPLLVRLSAVHAGARVEADVSEDPIDVGVLYFESGEFDGSMYAGPSGVAATFLLLVFAFLAALVVSAAIGALDVKELSAKAGSLAKSIQTQPGTPPQAPGTAPTHGAPSGNPTTQQPPHN